MTRPADPHGLSRVIAPAGVLPQAAERLDPSLPAGPDELVIDVESLNVDAASFRQLEAEAGGDPARIGAAIAAIVGRRGKLHNPVTGSGGMLIGRVREVGPSFPEAGRLRPGDPVATLVSLTLTPLSLASVEAVHVASDRVDVKGHAIVFASGVVARLPDDLPRTVALATLDVCGAPAHVARLARSGQTVLVLGAGKSGLLCCAKAKEAGARVIAVDRSAEALQALKGLGLADATVSADATRAVEVMDALRALTGGKLADLVVSCTTVPGTEMSAILGVREGGTVVFFSMATSFTAAALGAEGVGKDATLIVGNGYARGHAELALDLLRRNEALRRHFQERYG